MNVKDLVNKRIMVIGHNSPDTDTMVASYLLAKILRKFGLECEYASLEGQYPDDKSANLLRDKLDYNPYIITKKNINLYSYFLVDHNDVAQSVGNIDCVVGVIDHHENTHQFKTPIIKDLCSTTLVIYEMFKNHYNFSKEEKELIFLALLDDAGFGKNRRYKDIDKQIVRELGFKDDLEYYFTEYFVQTELKHINEVFNQSRLKIYNIGGITFKSTIIERLDNLKKDEYKKFIKAKKENMLGMWINYKNNTTSIYFKYKNNFFQKDFDHVASRSKEILPIIKDFILKDKHEKEN